MDGSSSNKRQVEAQRGDNAKRQNVTIGLEALECSVCSGPLKPPIYQCSLGHFICSSCRCENRDKKCHLCSAETSFERCFGIEHVVKSVTVPCCNAKYGCSEQVAYYQKEEHEKACSNAPCFCPESGCGFAGSTMALLGHLTALHKFPLTTLPDSDMVASLRLQPGLNVLRCTKTSYFFLLIMSLEPFGHAISVIRVQSKVTEPKYSCTMKYNCMTTGYSESTSCNIRSSSLSDGLPTVYDLILPKGKITDDRQGIMLTATIHQPLSLSRSRPQGKDSAPALETDDEDSVALRVGRLHPRGKGPTSAIQEIFSYIYDDDDVFVYIP
ncbi:unnamed protein product [Alopecurus aequalis]